MTSKSRGDAGVTAEDAAFAALFRWVAEFVEFSERGVAPTPEGIAAIRRDFVAGIPAADAQHRHAERCRG